MSKPKTKPRSTCKDDATIGLRIRGARLAANQSQTWLGDKLGISFQMIQKYERGTNRLSAVRLAQLSLIFEVPVTYFLEGVTTYGGKPTNGSAEATQFLATPHAHELASAYVRMEPTKRAVLLATSKALV